MILNCPACQARYVVPDSAVGTAGRQVRCAGCKHSWFQAPDAQAAAAPHRPAASAPLESAPEPEPDQLTVVEQIYEYPAEEPAHTRIRRIGLWLFVALAALAAAAAAAYYLGVLNIGGRQASAEAPLKIEHPRDPERTVLASGNELLRVYGRVVNVSDEPQRVPQIRADLKDGSGRIVHTFFISAPVPVLKPRQSESFDYAEMGVPKSARDLKLSFGPTSRRQ